MEKDDKFFTFSEIIKPAILYLLMRKNELTAREIQSKLGLKRQTTYNYLKELEEEGKIKIEYRQHQTKSHMNVGYYSRVKHKKKHDSDLEKKLKGQIYPSERYIKSLDEGISLKEDCAYCSGTVKDTILEQINFGIAALFEKKKLITDMSDEALKQFLKANRNFPGPSVKFFLFTNEEFEEFGKELSDLYERTLRKWLVEEDHKGKHDENLFLIGLFKE